MERAAGGDQKGAAVLMGAVQTDDGRSPAGNAAPAGIKFPEGRRLDCITIGRANMDLYTEAGRSIEESTTFHKSVGGSPANIAAAMARLGMRVGMITRVASDPIGRFVTRFLSGMGVDTARIVADESGASTSVAFAETRSSGSNTVLYRNNVADLLLSPRDIDRAYIADSAMVVVSGTALCASPSRDAVMLAVEYARAAGAVVVLDIDYRAYSWQSEESASVALMLAAERSDIVIGTREEFDALEMVYTGEDSAPGAESAAGSVTDRATAARLFAAGVRLVVIKRGEDGSTAYGADGSVLRGSVYPVSPQKPYGAGDAFAGAFLFQLFRGAPLIDCLSAGAANASINISRTRCAEDMADWVEITTFLKERNDAVPRTTV